MSQRRILITGATGGLGKALVREAIGRDHAVRATGRSVAAGEELRTLGAEFVRFDLECADAMSALVEGCDSVIHAAALSASWGPRAAFESANVDATCRLIEASQEHCVTRFVFVSSPSIFASLKDRVGIGEHAAPNSTPLNFYAQTKLAAERDVLAASTKTLACCAIRPRALVGDSDRVILPKLVELARRKRMPLPRGGQALIELTDLRDAAHAICEAEERAKKIAGRAVNISGGQPHTVRDIALQLADALGTSPRLVTIPIGAAHMLANVLERIASLTGSSEEPVLTRYTLATLGYSQTFDLEPAQRLLEYQPRYDALATLLDQARALAAQENAA